MKKKTRIGIDCRLAGKKHAGIGRYIENLVLNLPKNPKITWVLFFHDKTQADEVLKSSPLGGEELELSSSETREVRLTPIKHYSLAEQTKLPKIFKAAKLDLLHVPHFNIPIFYSGKLVLTIHDLLWHEQKGNSVTTLPKWQYFIKYLAYKFVARKAILKAKKIIVPSETIKNTLSNYYPSAKNKILVVKEGVSNNFKLQNQNVKSKTARNLLYVGSLYPHKNLNIIFNALQKMPDHKLSIVSARNFFTNKAKQQVKNLKILNQVNFLGYVSDEKLVKLYHNSFALVQPSLSEGFGLTGIEAMASGCPVLASEIPIFKEIYSGAAIYFDPKSANSFISAAKKLAKADRQKLIKKGQKQAKQYSWEKMAKDIFKIYQNEISS